MRTDIDESNDISNADEPKPPSSSLGAASQLKSLKAARVAKADSWEGDGAVSNAGERVVRKRIDLENEQWQKPKASGVVAAVVTSVACIAVFIIVAFALGGVQG